MITVVTKPNQFTPAGNPIIWQVSSSSNSIVYFKVILTDSETSSVINQLNIFPTPDYPNGSYIDLSKLLQNVVRWELNNDSYTLVQPISKTVRGYKIDVTEMNLSGGVMVSGDTFNDSNNISYVFNSELGRITRQNYLQVKYVINQTSKAQFLTNSPNFKKVNDISPEFLYLMQDGSFTNLFARVRTFDSSGQIIDSLSEPINDLTTYQAYRLNVSPKSLKDSSNVDFTNVSYYVVDVVDSSSIAQTEERVYMYEETPCYLEYVNVLWVNSLGGVDSYQFIAPQDSINVTRNTMKRNTFGINSEGIYSDINGGIYNPSEVILSNQVSSNTRMVSKHLSDEEAYWMQELYMSKQVFVELPDGSLVPCMLNGSSYSIPRVKYNRGSLNTITIELTLADGVIPAGVSAYSTTRSSIEFIDSQMNAIVLNIPGYSITPTPTRSYSQNYSNNYR